MAWRVEFDPKALDDLSKLDKQTQRRIAKFLRERIAVDENPRRLGGPLHGEKKGLWKYRVGTYRLICDIRDASILVLVLRVGNRKDIYRR